MVVYAVDINGGESIWRFSTMELALKCVEFFNLDEEYEYEIYQETLQTDDEELLRRMKK